MWGFLAASALAVVARSYDLSAPVQMGLTLPIIALGLIVLSMQMSPYPRRNPREDRARIALPVPSKAVAAIAAFGFASVALHGATTNWSVLYLQDEMGAAQGAAALSIPLFMAALTVARLLGDRITRRFSAAQIAYGSLFLAMLGAVIVLGATTLWVAALGFAIMGLGTALHYPLMVTAAAKLTDRPSSQNIAALTMILSVSILFVPLLIGAVAEMWGLRVGMGLMIPALALSFLFARALASTEPDA